MMARRDPGFTLIELMVSMAILSVIGAIVVGFIVSGNRAFLQADDETRGLADVRLVLDQVARDIRSSAGVLCDGGLADQADPNSADPSCAAHLQLWLDTDSDYVEESGEVVTWFVRQDGDHLDVIRQDAAGTTRVLATSLIDSVLFVYDATNVADACNPAGPGATGSGTPTTASLVTVTMQYDPLIGAGSTERCASTSVRIRNGRPS